MKKNTLLRPRKMKQIELTVLARDIDKVIEFLGRRSIIHFSENETDRKNSKAGSANVTNEAYLKNIQENLDKLNTACAWLGLPLPMEPEERSHLPTEIEITLAHTVSTEILALSVQEHEQITEKQKIEAALNEARAFANLDAPFSDLDDLSYLTLRIGRLDSKHHDELRENLNERAIIIPLDPGGDKVMAASSRRGRFALDSELKKADFVPITIPEGYKGVPKELLSGLEARLKKTEEDLADIANKKQNLVCEHGETLKSLICCFIMACIVEQLKSGLVCTKNVYLLSGWVAADMVKTLALDLEKITENSIAIRSFDPGEIAAVRQGREKVPVSLNHGGIVKGFESLVFSYGAPLYGSVDPTFFVAVFFTLFFGIMFGDVGQGCVLFILGLLCGKKGLSILSQFWKFSVPLRAVGVTSVIMGFLTGSFFTNEELFVHPTRAITGFLTGHPVDRILVLMPLPEYGGSVTKLFWFFGFTIALGVILNSIGLIINVVNRLSLKEYEEALFSKTGLAGIFFFWYALFIAVRFIINLVNPAVIFSLDLRDAIALALPVAVIFFGHPLWRLLTGKKPVFAEGLMVFIMEGFVEIIETVSTYLSNTISFLRVGAFALSHAVLSFIVFTFAEQVSHVIAGSAFSLLIFVIGNLIIIFLEGLIVAIQVVRLQYYEFFSKFFVETGVEFNPFRFRKGVRV